MKTIRNVFITFASVLSKTLKGSFLGVLAVRLSLQPDWNLWQMNNCSCSVNRRQSKEVHF